MNTMVLKRPETPVREVFKNLWLPHVAYLVICGIVLYFQRYVDMKPILLMVGVTLGGAVVLFFALARPMERNYRQLALRKYAAARAKELYPILQDGLLEQWQKGLLQHENEGFFGGVLRTRPELVNTATLASALGWSEQKRFFLKLADVKLDMALDEVAGAVKKASTPFNWDVTLAEVDAHLLSQKTFISAMKDIREDIRNAWEMHWLADHKFDTVRLEMGQK